jgi:hypothetical protein
VYGEDKNPHNEIKSLNPSLPALIFISRVLVNAIKPMRAKSRQPEIVKKAGWHRLDESLLLDIFHGSDNVVVIIIIYSIHFRRPRQQWHTCNMQQMQ